MVSYNAVYDRLYEIAADQGGYFTTKQAIAAGYADNTHPFHVKAGNWVREFRGIYRLAKYPLTEHPDMILGARPVRPRLICFSKSAGRPF